MTASQRFLRLFLPFAVGYVISYLLRNILSLLGTDLRSDMGISNGELGFLTAAYFITFSLSQIPLGLALDRFGPRRVQFVLFTIAALGTLIFALADSYWLLVFGRLLVGLGFACGLMAAFKAFVLFYPREQLRSVNGYLFALGGFGALLATKPSEWILLWIDWRGLFILLGGMILAVGITLLFVVPERDKETQNKPLSFKQLTGTMRDILRMREFWSVAPVNMLVNGTAIAIIGLWMGPYLRDVGGMSLSASATSLLWIACVAVASYAFWGWAGGYLARKGVSNSRWMLFGISAYSLALLSVFLFGIRTGLWPWMLVAGLANITTTAYAFMAEKVGAERAGTANALLNFLVFSGVFACQYLFGIVLDIVASMGFDMLVAYNVALGIVLALQSIGFASLYRYSRRKPVL